MLCTTLNKHSVRQFSVSRIWFSTYYDILKVSKHSSLKDIRNSYIKLSKELHPDKHSNSTKKHKEFVKLNEAYSVLSRADKRREYDRSLSCDSNVYQSKGQNYNYRQHPVWNDSSFYENKDKSQDKFNEQKAYYGVHGIKKVSNFWIVIFILIFTTIGVGVQVIAISNSFSFKRDALEKFSKKLGEKYDAVRKDAEKNDVDEQIQKIFGTQINESSSHKVDKSECQGKSVSIDSKDGNRISSDSLMHGEQINSVIRTSEGEKQLSSVKDERAVTYMSGESNNLNGGSNDGDVSAVICYESENDEKNLNFQTSPSENEDRCLKQFFTDEDINKSSNNDDINANDNSDTDGDDIAVVCSRILDDLLNRKIENEELVLESAEEDNDDGFEDVDDNYDNEEDDEDDDNGISTMSFNDGSNQDDEQQKIVNKADNEFQLNSFSDGMSESNCKKIIIGSDKDENQEHDNNNNVNNSSDSISERFTSGFSGKKMKPTVRKITKEIHLVMMIVM